LIDQSTMHRSTRKNLSEQINSLTCRARFPQDARTMLRLGAVICRSWLFKRKNAYMPSFYFPHTRNRRADRAYRAACTRRKALRLQQDGWGGGRRGTGTGSRIISACGTSALDG